MTATPDLPTHVLRLADLANRKTATFQLTPTAQERAAVAAYLEIIGIKKLTFSGEITPHGRSDWHLDGRLGATVVQACVATLAPVTTRIDEDVTRTYSADYQTPEGPEVEMTGDDTIDPLPATLDLGAVMIEALSLALPPFPRAEGADLGPVLSAEDGIAPMTDDDAKPFAGLGALRDKLAKDSGDDT